MQRNTFRTALHRSAAVAALAVSLNATSAAFAAEAPPVQLAAAAPPAAQAPVDEIVVTGTRVVRDGYEAPTPLTVVGAEALQNAATANVADFVNTLPSIAGSQSPQTSQASTSSGLAGLNTLNLRNLGSNRTLVLIDGQRSVASSVTGLTDVNNIPQGLVSRVDIVTGGASAAYGSDALSGVVNFVLDRTFTGVKGEVSGGITTYGDGENWKTALTAGTPFASGRGHVLISGEATKSYGIPVSDRDWNEQGAFIINNPAYTATNGQPRQLKVLSAALGQGSPGGIITNTALQGIEFGPGGTPRQFNYGSIVAPPYIVGGDWRSTLTNQWQSLDAAQNRKGLFLRTSYDLADTVTVFAQASYNNAVLRVNNGRQFNVANLTVRTGNPFIPASVQARMTALGLTQFTLGTMNADIPQIGTLNNRTTRRGVIGGNGAFDAADTEWTWDAYYQVGETKSSERTVNATQRDKFANAVDVVTSPTTGVPVCRITLTNPGSGCVPWNLMGVGVNSQAALNYILGGNAMSAPGMAYRVQWFKQDVMAANISGEPFELWAGPVSLAFGGERRTEKVRGISDPDSQANNWFVGNYLPNSGKYTVTEGYAEVVVPLAKDVEFARSIDLNAAVRATDYSTSGYVTTWKVGATWAPVDDLRFRVTRSRDIRAPNLAELFQAGSSNTNSVIDPFNNNQTVQYQGFAVGNPDLKPEIADTWGIGAVLSPTFLPGFQASFDYYRIDIAGAIGNVGAQQIVDFCFEGNQVFCAAITRGLLNGVNVITRIRTSPFNLIVQEARGYDVEASYRTSLDEWIEDWNGDLTLRFLGTRYLRNYSSNGFNPPTNTVGQNAGSGPAKFRWVASVNYDYDRYNANVTARGVSKGVYNNAWVECTTGCPTSTTTNITTDNQQIPGAVYLDLSGSYTFLQTEGGTEAEAFLNIRNVFDKDPAIIHQGPGGTAYLTINANAAMYDILGRVFRVGVRFRQ